MVDGDCGTGTAVGTPLTTSDSGTSATYTGTITSGTPAAAGSYKLCWAEAPTGSAASDFPLEVGTASLAGPTDLSVTLACTLGASCSQVLNGVDLAATSKVLMVDGDCGSGTAVGTPLTTSDSGASATYTGTITSGTPAAAGSYKLCWAAAPGGSAASDFPLEVGTASLAGPTDLSVTLACTLGVSCSQVLNGVDLA